MVPLMGAISKSPPPQPTPPTLPFVSPDGTSVVLEGTGVSQRSVTVSTAPPRQRRGRSLRVRVHTYMDVLLGGVSVYFSRVSMDRTTKTTTSSFRGPAQVPVFQVKDLLDTHHHARTWHTRPKPLRKIPTYQYSKNFGPHGNTWIHSQPRRSDHSPNTHLRIPSSRSTKSLILGFPRPPSFLSAFSACTAATAFRSALFARPGGPTVSAVDRCVLRAANVFPRAFILPRASPAFFRDLEIASTAV